MYTKFEKHSLSFAAKNDKQAKRQMHLKTPRGTFRVSAVFGTAEDAIKAGYGYYFTYDLWDIYQKYPKDKPYTPKTAIVDRSR